MSENNDDYYEKIDKMLSLTVSAVRGEVPVGQVTLPLTQIANGNLAPPDARELARVCNRIIAGERDPITLVEYLPRDLTERVWEALDVIKQPEPEFTGDEREEITFEQLVEKVAQACTGEVMLWQQLWDFTEELSTDERMPAEIKTLGEVLRKILAGERQKHVLDPLAPQHRWAVEQLLDWLNDQAMVPGADHQT